MNKERFDAILAAYGADPRRWPADERAAAEAFAAREKVDLSEAREIDALLARAAPPGAPSDLLQARIMRAAPRPAAMLRGAGLALAACMIAGVLVGYGVGLNAPASEQDVDGSIVAAFAGGDWQGEGL